MRHDTDFAVRYVTNDPVPIRDIIESLRGVETILGEMGQVLPKFVDGLDVQRIEVKVRQIAQESPLRELFVLSLFLTFQESLEAEVVSGVENLTGYHLPENIDTMVTVLVMVLLFYGVGAIKDFVVGNLAPGPSQRMLNGLIAELAKDTGKSADDIKKTLDERYGDKTLWKRLTGATSRFFGPSKKQDSAPVEVNDRSIDRETVQDIPQQFLIEHEADVRPARNFENVVLELHAKDKDNSGRGWAAVPHGLSSQRLRLKLMEDVAAADLWGRDVVRGDITVVYEKVGSEMVAKEIHLHRLQAETQ